MAKIQIQPNEEKGWPRGSSWKTKQQWKKWERVGMRPHMDLDDLVLNWSPKGGRPPRKRIPDLAIKGAIQSIEIERTMDGASTVTLRLNDPKGKIFSEAAGRSYRSQYSKRRPQPVDEGWDPINTPSLRGRPVEIELDDVAFRLTQVTYVDSTEELTMVFEDRIVHWLRQVGKDKAKRANRANTTRAEFILSLLREVNVERVPFVCPSLHKKQKIARAEQL